MFKAEKDVMKYLIAKVLEGLVAGRTCYLVAPGLTAGGIAARVMAGAAQKFPVAAICAVSCLLCFRIPF